MRFGSDSADSLFIPPDGIRGIDTAKILWFAGSELNAKKAIAVKIANEQDYLFWGTFKQFEGTLKDNFFKCHDSYIVNVDRIVKLDIVERKAYFDTGDACLVSRSNIASLRNKLKNERG